MNFADASLARRIEAAEAAIARGCTAGYPETAALELAGGCAIFAGADSPLTNAIGLGLHGPVSGAEISVLEGFFQRRGARVVIDLCPLADPGLIQSLSERGYRATEFNNVLVKRLRGWEIAATPRVRRAASVESGFWAHTVGRGFFDQQQLTAAEMEIGRAIFAMPGAWCYLSVDENGEAAGGAASAIYSGLAVLFADSTIRRFRNRGLHRELIAARLNDAVAQGCDMAAASTQPGSASQRNYERSGFSVAYTKVTLASPLNR